MSGHVVIDDHDDLTDIGSLRHAELDRIILEGVVPTLSEGISPPSLTEERSVGIALLPSDNTFAGINTFETVNVNGDLNVYGTRNEIQVSNLDIDNTVITLGYGTAGELPDSDRGIVFTASGPNPSLFWDHDQSEFRLGIVDVASNVSEFPDPLSTGHGGYASFRAGATSVESLDTPIISSASGTVQVLGVDDLTIGNILDASNATTSLGNATIIDADITTLKASSILIADGTQDYLERYIKPGSGIDIQSDPQDPGSLVASVSRQKEVVAAAQFVPIGVLLPSNIVSSMSSVTPENLDVYVNGVLVSQGTNYDYTVEANGLKFYFALESDDIITIIGY